MGIDAKGRPTRKWHIDDTPSPIMPLVILVLIFILYFIYKSIG